MPCEPGHYCNRFGLSEMSVKKDFTVIKQHEVEHHLLEVAMVVSVHWVTCVLPVRRKKRNVYAEHISQTTIEHNV